jgi:hypothetical protein
MPFQSEKQRRYLWANEPEIARDWTDTYGSGIAKALGGRIGFANGRDVWNQYQLTSHGPFGGPLGYLGFKPQAFEDQDFSMDNLIMGGEYVPGADLNKAYRLRMNEELKSNQPISYSETETIPNPDYYGLNIGRNYIPTEERGIGGLEQLIDDDDETGTIAFDPNNPQVKKAGILPFSLPPMLMKWMKAKVQGEGIGRLRAHIQARNLAKKKAVMQQQVADAERQRLQARVTAQANQQAARRVAGGEGRDYGHTETRASSGWESSPFAQGGLAWLR